MLKKFKHYLVAAIVLTSGFAVVVPQQPALALNPSNKVQKGIDAAGGGGTSTTSLNDAIKQVINLLLFVIGAVAVIVIVIGGLRYVLSAGDQSAVKAAKDTILYAVVGLVVAMLAYAIVNFVVDAF